jgi:hypothetical protein
MNNNDYLKALEEAYPLDQVEREVKEMIEEAEHAKIQRSENYAKAVQTVGYLELNEQLKRKK